MHQLNNFSGYIISKDSLVIQRAEILLKENLQLLGIISDDPTIRNWSNTHYIPVLDSMESLLATKKSPFDYLFSVVNSKILPHKTLTLPRRAAINFHNSPLSKYAGLLATTDIPPDLWVIFLN